MTLTDATLLRKRLVRVITRRVGGTGSTGAVVEAARHTHDDLVAVLTPLISEAGVQALLGRALDLAQREYPVERRSGYENAQGDSRAQLSLWLNLQVPSAATDAAAAMFATFAQLLAALIGEQLTTRYLETAWPDGFSEPAPGRKKT